MDTEFPTNVSKPQPMVFDAEAHLAEEQLQLLESTLNKSESPKCRCRTRRPTDFNIVGQYLQPLKTFIKKITSK
jgi:hypothetical protein